VIQDKTELIGFVLFATASVVPVLPSWHYLSRLLREWRMPTRESVCRKFLLSVLGGAAVYGFVVVDALWVEPNSPYLETHEMRGAVDKPVRILHLSDLHIERNFPARERWLLDTVKGMAPDLILISGDIHQMDNFDVESLRRVLASLQAPLGVYACTGYDDERVLKKAAPQIQFLSNQGVSLSWGGKTIGLCGLEDFGKREQAYAAIASAPFRIAMQHKPDLAEEAAAHNVNLYLCGHTHGGQVRIPFWGAIITNAETGKRFEDGFYQVGKTLVHTSRGLGVEPFPVEVRFLCRPEITLITVCP
jgi:uncharacterized protein